MFACSCEFPFRSPTRRASAVGPADEVRLWLRGPLQGGYHGRASHSMGRLLQGRVERPRVFLSQPTRLLEAAVGKCGSPTWSIGIRIV
jgi:hypothetical protein